MFVSLVQFPLADDGSPTCSAERTPSFPCSADGTVVSLVQLMVVSLVQLMEVHHVRPMVDSLVQLMVQ